MGSVETPVLLRTPDDMASSSPSSLTDTERTQAIGFIAKMKGAIDKLNSSADAEMVMTKDDLATLLQLTLTGVNNPLAFETLLKEQEFKLPKNDNLQFKITGTPAVEISTEPDSGMPFVRFEIQDNPQIEIDWAVKPGFFKPIHATSIGLTFHNSTSAEFRNDPTYPAISLDTISIDPKDTPRPKTILPPMVENTALAALKGLGVQLKPSLKTF